MDGGKVGGAFHDREVRYGGPFYTRRQGLFLLYILHIPRPWIPGPQVFPSASSHDIPGTACGWRS